MKQIKWNDSWKFWVDKDSFALVWNIPEEAKEVTLPHDAMIIQPANPDSANGGNTGFRDGGVYTYVKMLYAPEEYRDRTVMLKFEGVYMNAFVYVNGQLAAKNRIPISQTAAGIQVQEFTEMYICLNQGLHILFQRVYRQKQKMLMTKWQLLI